MKKKFLKSAGDYIDGAFQRGPVGTSHILQSPADLQDKVFCFSVYPEQAEKACHSAFKAYPKWRDLSLNQRVGFIKKLAQIYRKEEEEIAFLISRQTGKPLWESRAEARALSEKARITLSKALPLVQEGALFSARKGAGGKIMYRARGVCLVLGPFNMPAHLPNGHILPALALGNTVIFKPSEKTPAVAEKLAHCFHKAGFPKGVFNVVQGGKKTAQALLQNPLVKGVFFTGSYEVGSKIQKSLLSRPEKILALEMGGKNSALVWQDADLNHASEEILKASFLSAGQRCSSTSRLILHKKIKDKFLKIFLPKLRQISIGPYWKNPFMGALIDKKALNRFLWAGREALKEGAFFHLRGKALTQLNGFYVSPTLVEPAHFCPHSFYQNEELFSPFLALYSVKEEEEALDLIHQSGYGLSLSVFSKSSRFAKKICQRSEVGVFHWNLGCAGASSHLPFGGLGKSGNDRPAGLFAVYHCVSPVAWLQKLDQ